MGVQRNPYRPFETPERNTQESHMTLHHSSLEEWRARPKLFGDGTQTLMLPPNIVLVRWRTFPPTDILALPPAACRCAGRNTAAEQTEKHAETRAYAAKTFGRPRRLTVEDLATVTRRMLFKSQSVQLRRGCNMPSKLPLPWQCLTSHVLYNTASWYIFSFSWVDRVLM